MSDHIHRDLRQPQSPRLPQPHHCRYPPAGRARRGARAIFDREYFQIPGDMGYGMPRPAPSFVAEQPSGYHSRRRNNSLGESTLVDEHVQGHVPSAFLQDPPSYIDAASSVAEPPTGHVLPGHRRRRLDGPMWVEPQELMESLVLQAEMLEQEEARRQASGYYTLYQDPPTPNRHVEPSRHCAIPFCPVCVNNQRPNRREEGVTVTLDKSFDKVGFMILSDDGESATWVGQGGLSTPPTLSKKRTAPTNVDSSRLPVQGVPAADLTRRQEIEKAVDPGSSIFSTRHRRPMPRTMTVRANPAPSEKAASNKDADETKSVKSTKSKRSIASRKSDERGSRADTIVGEGSTLGINLFFD